MTSRGAAEEAEVEAAAGEPVEARGVAVQVLAAQVETHSWWTTRAQMAGMMTTPRDPADFGEAADVAVAEVGLAEGPAVVAEEAVADPEAGVAASVAEAEVTNNNRVMLLTATNCKYKHFTINKYYIIYDYL